ncbi:MAG: O-antigen ligase family protein [Burkholderiales bacterium]
MTAYVVLLAAVASVVVLARRGLEDAFLKVWIPCFLAFPFAFWVHPGIPNTNFAQAAIIPLVPALLLLRLRELRIGLMEVLLALYLVVRIVADFLGRGYGDAQNYTYYLLTLVVAPYLMGRYLIASRRMDVATARMFVLVFVLFFPLFLFELKFWVSPVYKLLSPFFPDAGSGLSLRWGLARTAGTFEHPILACIMIVAVYRLHKWLAWSGEWDRPQAGVLAFLQRMGRFIPIAFKHQVSIVLILMALMTISRGPWIGAFAGAALAAVGNLRNRRRGLAIFFAVLAAAAIVGQLALDAYITPREGEILSGEAKTMLYRKVMIDQYKAFLLERVWTGWGLTKVPKIPGMESVDNAFFLLALQHGVIALALFVLIFVYAIASQIRLGLRAPAGTPPLGFTFSGIYLMCFIAFSTVYMGSQTEPMLFLLLGWGENLKHRAPEAAAAGETPETAPAAPFRRILA